MIHIGFVAVVVPANTYVEYSSHFVNKKIKYEEQNHSVILSGTYIIPQCCLARILMLQ